MIEFEHLWAFALLPLPLIMAFAIPPYKETKDSLQVPYFQQLVTISGAKPSRGASVLQRKWFQGLVLVLAWVLITTAAAKPQWVSEPIEIKKSARDLMLAVDLSGSMAAEDFTNSEGQLIDRLTAVKQVLQQFIPARKSDRIGLIVFGDAPYLQAPFTDALDTVQHLLIETEVGMAGQSTAFGDAIGLAISTFQGSASENRVLIVLTDGNDTGSKVPPMDAARVASANGVSIYPIAMGDPTSIGEDAVDVDTLKVIAETTGGKYFEALDRASLEQAYQEIDKLEPELYESLSYRPKRDIYYIPLAAFAALFLLTLPVYALLGQIQRRRKRYTND
ncbi:VWA domain-containing protein [Teredinibacter franksiae]|uniref:VWA domain-containing protein n=1 Tax=Teredinibacter franksiae TaxID=2761453 RepID=UPI0016256A68|nr:VWA domain-containing protein [Teredinibacter franksiae]